MASEKKTAKKKASPKKAVKAKPIKVLRGKKTKDVKRKQPKGKSKAVKHKKVKHNPVATKASFDAKTASLYSELRLVRQALDKNDLMIVKKLGEKNKLENFLNSLLKKNFASEKNILLALKASSAKKQTALRKEISSLSAINKVYEEKKARIDLAKKKQSALQKQLKLLESKAGA